MVWIAGSHPPLPFGENRYHSSHSGIIRRIPAKMSARSTMSRIVIAGLILALSHFCVHAQYIVAPGGNDNNSYIVAPGGNDNNSYIVAPGGKDNNSCTSVSSPCATGQGALEKIPMGRSGNVVFQPGVYEGLINNYYYRAVTLSGSFNPDGACNIGAVTLRRSSPGPILFAQDPALSIPPAPGAGLLFVGPLGTPPGGPLRSAPRANAGPALPSPCGRVRE